MSTRKAELINVGCSSERSLLTKMWIRFLSELTFMHTSSSLTEGKGGSWSLDTFPLVGSMATMSTTLELYLPTVARRTGFPFVSVTVSSNIRESGHDIIKFFTSNNRFGLAQIVRPAWPSSLSPPTFKMECGMEWNMEYA